MCIHNNTELLSIVFLSLEMMNSKVGRIFPQKQFPNSRKINVDRVEDVFVLYVVEDILDISNGILLCELLGVDNDRVEVRLRGL